MAHFAKLDENNVVIQVLVVNNDVIQDLPFPESEPIGVEFCQLLFGSDTRWVQTSYNGSFRKRYAGISCIYDADLDAFIPPKPEENPSWVIDPEKAEWVPPVPKPTDGKLYRWDEPTLSWVLAGS